MGLCAGAEWAYDEVERLLPRNTCALSKSFMGFKIGKVCPYVESCDLVIGETTCDGKKKAYELFGELAPVYVMELPQMKRPADQALWRGEIDRLVAKLEEVTGRRLTAEALSKAIEEVNDKRRALQRLNAPGHRHHLLGGAHRDGHRACAGHSPCLSAGEERLSG